MNTALFFLCLATLGGPAPIRDPGAVIVVIDDVKSTGFRIADGSKLVTRLMKGLKERVTSDGVIYHGVLSSMRKMNALVKEDTGAQERNRVFYEAAVKQAPYRLVAKYGKYKRPRKKVRKKGDKKWGPKAQSLTFVCLDNATQKELHRFEKVYENFDALIEGAISEIATFCPEIKAKEVNKPKVEEAKKPLKAWTPPPRRD